MSTGHSRSRATCTSSEPRVRSRTTLGADAVAAAGGQCGVHLALDEAAGRVVAPEAAASGLHDAVGLGGAQAQVRQAERHDEVVLQRALPVGHRLGDDVGHADVALHPGREGAVSRGTEADVGHEVGEHDLLHAGLAERRQHPLDVAQEEAVRARSTSTPWSSSGKR